MIIIVKLAGKTTEVSPSIPDILLRNLMVFSVCPHACTHKILTPLTAQFLNFRTTLLLSSCTCILLRFQKAIRQAAESIEKLANTAREELPATMAAVRLSGMEISDLTMELSDLRCNSAQSSYRPPCQHFVPPTSIQLCANLFSVSISTLLLNVDAWNMYTWKGICMRYAFCTCGLQKLQTFEPANDGPHLFRKRRKHVQDQILLTFPVRLRGVLSDHCSSEISEGVRSSARAVQAAEDGIRRIGTIASSRTLGIVP